MVAQVLLLEAEGECRLLEQSVEAVVHNWGTGELGQTLVSHIPDK